VLKSAFVAISEKTRKLECTVRSISEAGAALQVSTTIGIPQIFDIIFDVLSVAAEDRYKSRSFVWIGDNVRSGSKADMTLSN
jgi:hypothetical protein